MLRLVHSQSRRKISRPSKTSTTNLDDWCDVLNMSNRQITNHIWNSLSIILKQNPRTARMLIEELDAIATDIQREMPHDLHNKNKH